MLFLEHENGKTLVVGLGHGESVLSFVEHGGATFHSVGDLGRTGCLRFWCRDQLDEFMAEMAIPELVAVRAAFEFFRTGDRPVEITWEADW